MARFVVGRGTRLRGIGRGRMHGGGGGGEWTREGHDACVHRHDAGWWRPVAPANARINNHEGGRGEA